MKTKSRTIFWVCLSLLLSFATIAVACPPPSCPDCYYWNGGCICEPDSQCGCEGKTCPNCRECVDCQCVPISGTCLDTGCDVVGNCEYCDDGEGGTCECECPDENPAPYSKLLGCPDYFWYTGSDLQFFSSGCEEISWSASGGNPSSGFGPGFLTQWSTPGVKTVTATSPCGSSGSVQVTLCNPGEFCCDDGSCALPCEQTETSNCNEVDDIPCPPCFNYGFGNCSEHEMHIQLNAKIYTCSGGCPGECDWVQIDCAIKYGCIGVIDSLAICDYDPAVEAFRCVGPFAWDCWECYRDPGDDGDTGWTLSKQCQ